MDFTKILESEGYGLVVDIGKKLLIAIAIYIIGRIVISGIMRLLKRAMEKADTDATLKKFLTSFAKYGLQVVLLVIIVGTLGVEMTALATLIGAVGLAIGLAVQGSLSNFAGGVLLIVNKPFKVGQVIKAMGEMGIVEEINLLSTTLKTFNGQTIYIPNGPLANSTITNVTAREKRRVDFVFGIGYDDDIDKAKQVLMDIITANEFILDDPKPMIYVSELGDSAVNLTVWVWTKTPDFGKVFLSLQETVKKAFDKEGISFPYPQTDVHLNQIGTIEA